MTKKILLIVLKLIPSIIMLQTLFFKFTASEESVYIFSKLGMEPYGRIGVGIMELLAVILIMVTKTRFYGAALGVGIMVGAIFSHLSVLGIVVQDDGGLLFTLAIVTLISCLILMYIYKDQALKLLNKK
ncbi:MAG: DoxX family protein [Aquaticitalea sp.]